MSDLFKVAGPAGEPSASVLLVHGLGGHAYDTWRSDTSKRWHADRTFWPRWLADEDATLAVYTISHDAPVSRLHGTALHFTDQATNILNLLLAKPVLAHGPLILIGHSLGGLIIKQLLRTADSIARHEPRARDLLERVEKVAFLATPHAGSGLASWGDRLRILVWPTAATASLVRNDPNLRDLNNWNRDWANDRQATHLILTESKRTILGKIVPPDSADPGLANVRPVSIRADHTGICKPADRETDIYVLVRDFVMRPVQRPKPLEERVAERVLAAFDARGETARAVQSGIERQTILALAQRLKPDEVIDLDQAVKELNAAVEIAISVSQQGTRGSNLGDLVDTVLARVADKTRAGDIDGAARVADEGFAEWERSEAERRADAVRSGIALLEAGLEQDILRRDAAAAARRVERIVALEHPDDASARFAAMVDRQNAFYARGRDQGVNFDLLVAIEIGRLALDSAQDAQQRGTSQNNLGNALQTLGGRESGTARLEEAVAAYRAALTELTRERVPLDWAMTQTNLGAALRTLGDRESGPTRLEEAVAAFRAALTEVTRERVPLDWAMTQNNLGTALQTLGARESGTAQLEEAVAAYRAALTEWTRERVPLDWAATQNNLGAALATLGARESGTTRLEEAVAAYRAALTERTRERVPLDWAMTQNNLGNALGRLGGRESGTARLEEAVAAYRAALTERTRERVPLGWATTQSNLGNVLLTLGERENETARLEQAVAAFRAALTEWTRERVPLDWALSTGSQGVALMVLAERTDDEHMARTALSQIELALTTARDGGHDSHAAYCAAQLSKVQALVERLSKR